MSFQQPFAGRLLEGGTPRSMIPWVAPSCALTVTTTFSAHTVLHKNHGASSTSWSDVTAAVNNFAANDVPIFDATNPTYDAWMIALEAGDDLGSIDFLLGASGVYAGTAAATIKYRDTSGTWQTVSGGTVDFRTTGVKSVPVALQFDAVGEFDDPRDPTAARIRGLIVTFSGVSAVMTAPLASRLWIKRAATAVKNYLDFTDMLTSTAPYQAVQVMPRNGDLTLFCFAAPFSRMRAMLERARDASWESDLVYSQGGGVFAVIPTGNQIDIGSAGTGNELFTSATLNSNLFDVFDMPNEWATDTIIANGNDHTGFWVGWRYTADGALPQLAMLITALYAQQYASGATGVRAGETASYTSFNAVFDETVSFATRIVVANDRTGQRISVEIPPNTNITAPQVISFPVQPTDEILMDVLSGDTVVGVADGYIKLA